MSSSKQNRCESDITTVKHIFSPYCRIYEMTPQTITDKSVFFNPPRVFNFARSRKYDICALSTWWRMSHQLLDYFAGEYFEEY